MNKQLATAVSSILALSAYSGLGMAQDQAADRDEAKPTQLDLVVVTGSLIPQIQQETASPVIAITAEDMQRQGFRNVYDVLRAQPLATGAVQDNQFSAGFTPGATTISLLGLSPGFTLILLDGRPLADYPLLYNGQANFTDLSSIPSAMIERIDVLPGNQSAIYGSAAIAGVVNIILKTHLEGIQLAARAGGYEEGGGDNYRFQLTGGKTWDNFDVTYGLQYSSEKPIWGFQRKRFDSSDDDPNPALHFGSRTFLVAHIVLAPPFPTVYDDPGQAACDGLAGNFGGTTMYDNRPGRGFYCGSHFEPGYSTILNEQTGASAYVNANLKLGENAELYGNLLYSDNRVESNGGTRFWIPDINGSQGFIWDDTSANPLRQYQHIFSPEETGGLNVNNDINKSQSYNLALGARGSFGDSNWDYDAYYSRSQYELQDRQKWPLAADIEDFFRDQFLGPQLGTYTGYPLYHPNEAAFYQSLTPDQYNSFVDTIRTDSKTWTHNVNFKVTNPALFELPAGSVGVAGLVQFGEQSWDNPTDPRVIGNEFWGLNGTQGSGDRESWAGAVEFRVPIISTLTANLSTRYDSYKNIDAGSDARTTYKFGLELRPVDTLLLRANYATAFRAPDMAYIYAGDSGFFTTVIDYFRCEEANLPLNNCTFANSNIEGNRHGNLGLKSITADSYGFGFIWSPSDRFDLRADYYNVSIDNEVSDLSIDRILRDENECRQGREDINSPTCVDALSRIDRSALTNQLLLVTIEPINISKEKVSGIIAGTTVRFGGGRAGDFEFSLDYNESLTHTYTQFPGDSPIDLLTDGFNSLEFDTVTTADLVWDIGRFTTSVHGTRYSATPNFTAWSGAPSINGIGPGNIAPYYLYNLNVNYRLTDNSDVSVTVNNIEDKGPPKDDSYSGVTAYPYYNIFDFNGYGRAVWVQYKLNLGSNN